VPPEDFAVHVVLGSGAPTAFHSVYGLEEPVRDLCSLADANPAFVTVSGDGTVPAASAVAHGLPTKRGSVLAVPGLRHFSLMFSETVFEHVWDRAISPHVQV
jgi:hypothetical protein